MERSHRVHVVIDGRVQGVFFRASCADRAREAGLAGWVRNRSDGRVEAVFEGDPASVAVLVAWCRTGPPGATVSDVEVREEAVRGEVGFSVVR